MFEEERRDIFGGQGVVFKVFFSKETEGSTERIVGPADTGNLEE